MIALDRKYQPKELADFIGLDRVKAILGQLIAAPYDSAWLFLGPSGLGKTTIALAAAGAIHGEVHHIPSKKCDAAAVDEVIEKCWYVPFGGGKHIVLVDEADQMSNAAQLAFLSKLDATAVPPDTIFFFTANDTRLLQDRFLSRCRTIKFTKDGLLDPLVQFLETVWIAEADANWARPDFRMIADDAQCNVRQALMDLEVELVARQAGLAPAAPARLAVVPLVPFTAPAANADTIDAYELAVARGVDRATIYAWVKKKRLPKPVKLGRRLVWRRREVLREGACG